jgi:hypothetical protein
VQHICKAFLKSYAGRTRRSQGIDASAEIDDCCRINSYLPSPRIDIPTVLAVERVFYNMAAEISTNVASDRRAVTRHKDRPSFNMSMLTGAKSSPMVGFQTSLPK